MTTTPTVAPPRFNLRERIHQVMAASGTADPKKIAHEVLRSISMPQAAAALAEALPEYVRIVVGQQRPRVPDGSGAAKSWKLEKAREYVQKLLQQRVDISGTGADWKFLTECNSEDLAQLADLQRKRAAELVDSAAWYEKIAGLLDENEAESVGELPESVLLSLATNGELAQP